MAVSGLPDECENHAVCIARLALDMNEMAESVKMEDEPVVSYFDTQSAILILNFPPPH